MLNDLVISRKSRERFQRETRSRRFATRLPEPQDEEKVFRFEQVQFRQVDSIGIVDYVSLSDGEHQLAQILGVFSMVSFQNVLFLLDEPESHFNPRWRVKFMSRVLAVPTDQQTRCDEGPARWQEALMTTHSPFVPSDMPREKVLIFAKENGSVEVTRPSIQTFGATFDVIVEECFGIRPPISDIPKEMIERLMRSDRPSDIREGIKKLGDSSEKLFLADHLRHVERQPEG
jgi:restriction system-associated AAA family ATPase